MEARVLVSMNIPESLHLRLQKVVARMNETDGCVTDGWKSVKQPRRGVTIHSFSQAALESAVEVWEDTL